MCREHRWKTLFSPFLWGSSKSSLYRCHHDLSLSGGQESHSSPCPSSGYSHCNLPGQASSNWSGGERCWSKSPLHWLGLKSLCTCPVHSFPYARLTVADTHFLSQFPSALSELCAAVWCDLFKQCDNNVLLCLICCLSFQVLVLSFAFFLVPGLSPGKTAMDISMTYVGGNGECWYCLGLRML